MRKTALWWAGHASIACLLAATLGAQAPSPPPPAPEEPQAPAPAEPAAQQPTFRAGINFVRVDVIVTDRQGNPVTDLTQQDFEVSEDNKPQAIETFRLVKIDTATPVVASGRSIRTRDDEETAAANENARIFVFFLDDYNTRLGTSMFARKPLVDFVQNQVGPNDLLAVMYPLSPLDSVVLTRNHASVVNALERFEGRKFNYEPRNAIEEKYALYPTEVVERIRRQVSLSALEGLSVKLGALREGRKAIVLVSEGYTAMLPPQMRDQIAAMPGMGNPNRNNPSAGENNTNEERARFSADLDVQRELQDVFDAANRSNTAIYAVDPRGLTTGDFDITDNISFRTSGNALSATQDTLRVLADETDGRAIVNRNDLAKGMQQIIRDSSFYYLVGYNSSPAPQDGKFHEIKVRIKRPGVQIRARKGYWALTATEAVRANTPAKPGAPPAVSRALATLAQPTGTRYARTWVGTSPGEGGKTKVTFVWEPVAAAAGTRREEARSVNLVAASPDGDLYFKGRVGDEPAPAVGSADGGAPPVAAAPRAGASVSFEVPPGKLQLRVAIAGAGSGTLDTDDREVVVPDLTAPDLMFSTPRVHLARSARELQQVTKDLTVAPTASRDFRRTDRVILRFETIGTANVAPTVTSRLLNRQGQRMADLVVAKPADPAQPFVVDLPLSSLGPGEYLVELAAAVEGREPVTELVAFRVGS
ncbi:MAG: VWA domain-containing protein [Vicinamibacterales bacterium]